MNSCIDVAMDELVHDTSHTRGWIPIQTLGRREPQQHRTDHHQSRKCHKQQGKSHLLPRETKERERAKGGVESTYWTMLTNPCIKIGHDYSGNQRTQIDKTITSPKVPGPIDLTSDRGEESETQAPSKAHRHHEQTKQHIPFFSTRLHPQHQCQRQKHQRTSNKINRDKSLPRKDFA